MRLENSQELDTILKHSRDAFLVADNKGHILFFNSAIEELSGFSLKEYLGKDMNILVKKGLISRSTALEAINKKETITGEVETIKGKKLLVTSSPVIEPSGRVGRVVSNVRGLSVIQKKMIENNSNKCDPAKLGIDDRVVYYDKNNSYYVVQSQSSNEELVFKDNSMKKLVELVLKLSWVESTVLIYGETGTGKELIADLMHNCSPRANYPFVKVNCASIPVNLIESELFGYEQGSFTGASKQGKKGYFEQADKGTLLLDEIAELPLEVQAKLLRVLQDKKINKVGDSTPRPVDIRIIAATNRNLEQMVKEKKFREDLYFRLNVVPIEVPPLRDRVSDIPVLFHYFSKKCMDKYGMHEKEISPDVIEHLLKYPWPGNVRELANLVERILVTTSSETATLAHLFEPYLSCSSRLSSDKFSIYGIYPLKETVDEFELTMVKKAVEQSGTYMEATRVLGISLSSLMRKVKKLKNNKMLDQ